MVVIGGDENFTAFCKKARDACVHRDGRVVAWRRVDVEVGRDPSRGLGDAQRCTQLELVVVARGNTELRLC